MLTFLLLASLLSFCADTNALLIPFRVVDRTSSLGRRDTVNGTISVIDAQNAIYIGQVVIGGTQYDIQLDTGSSDLWIQGNPDATTGLGEQASLSYAIGTATGEISTATVNFAGYNISDQVYLHVPTNATFAGGLFSTGASGILGLGPSGASVLRSAIGNASADSLVDRIFESDVTTPNFITFLLQRAGDGASSIQGQFTVGEVASGYESITSQPQLPVVKLASYLSENQHWTTYVDSIVGPDNTTIAIKTNVPSTPSGKLVAVIDSGFTLPQVPRSVSDTIYGRVQGAVYDTTNQWWTVPCGQYLNISFVLGGVTFPVHPFDTVSSDFGLKDSNGNVICLGAFQPITSAFSITNEYDLILGDGFLRNSYTLLDYGDFVSNGSTSVTANPYVQLLPITTPSSAFSDFVSSRLNGDPTAPFSSQYTLLPSSQEQHSPQPLSQTVQHYEADVLRYLPEIITGCAVVVLLIVGCIVWTCCCRARRQRMKARKTAANIPTSSRGNYKQIGEPALPGNAVGMRPMGYADQSAPPPYYIDPYQRVGN